MGLDRTASEEQAIHGNYARGTGTVIVTMTTNTRRKEDERKSDVDGHIRSR